jgi:hypothetical protein
LQLKAYMKWLWSKIKSYLKIKQRTTYQMNTLKRLDALESRLNILIMAQADFERRRVQALPPGTPLGECEFKVYSQFGEDGILQHLVKHVPIVNRRFVEFGVEDFREANCRYLMEVEPWRGLILDGDPELENKIKSQPFYFFRELVPYSTFVTAENINGILSEMGFTGDIGVLSVDIDGNDYWVWKAIDVVTPRIVIIEYNSVFGAEQAVTIPYNPNFFRRTAHFSWLYAGASLSALVLLGNQKGYSFVGSNSAGNNAFFVRNDVLGRLKPLTAKEGYVESTFRESRDPDGNMTYLNGIARLQVIEEMPLIDVPSCKTIKAGELNTSSAEIS